MEFLYNMFEKLYGLSVRHLQRWKIVPFFRAFCITFSSIYGPQICDFFAECCLLGLKDPILQNPTEKNLASSNRAKRFLQIKRLNKLESDPFKTWLLLILWGLWNHMLYRQNWSRLGAKKSFNMCLYRSSLKVTVSPYSSSKYYGPVTVREQTAHHIFTFCGWSGVSRIIWGFSCCLLTC